MIVTDIDLRCCFNVRARGCGHALSRVGLGHKKRGNRQSVSRVRRLAFRLTILVDPSLMPGTKRKKLSSLSFVGLRSVGVLFVIVHPSAFGHVSPLAAPAPAQGQEVVEFGVKAVRVLLFVLLA